MTTVKRKICITSIITFLLAVACPFNANAFDIVSTVKPTGRAWEWGTALYAIADEQGGVASATTNITGKAIFMDIPAGRNAAYNIWILKGITKDIQIDFKEGHYYKTELSFNITSSDRYGVQLPKLNRLVMPSNAPYKLVSIDADTIQCYEIGWTEGRNTVLGDGNLWQEQNWNGCRSGYVKYSIILQATRNATGAFQLGDGAQWMFESLVIKDTSQASHSIRFGTLTPLAITEYEPDSPSTINEQQQQAGEQAQQDGQTAGNAAQTDAETGSASLLQGAGSIIGALTDTQASNCTINLNMGHIDLGTQDFCQGDIGPIRPVIATITNILFAFVSFRVFAFLIGVMFGLFDEFFGTKTEKGSA